ncbi:cytochrome [Ancylostoma ceylanicum]|uniref:Cytochrome n=1 Tax=Ancylostoma ceylanicum TaxID=53326 RepID=A0A0D6L6I0_9BILA|nr:cytochrome [Ancylostoma ceylanicum]
MTTGAAKGDASSPKSIPEGDYEKGKKIYKYRCAQCHTINSKRSLAGPTLHGLMGRMSGTAPGYVYSPANKHLGVVWTRETLFDYLADPRKYIPGTKMFFVGLKKPEDRADVIKYMEVEGAKPPTS